jgi:hypothetical protein
VNPALDVVHKLIRKKGWGGVEMAYLVDTYELGRHWGIFYSTFANTKYCWWSN